MRKSLALAFVFSLLLAAVPGVSEAAGYLVITTPAPLPSAVVGGYYSASVSFVNTTGYPVAATVSGLPSGIGPSYLPDIPDSYGSIAISGFPASAGFYQVTIYLTNYIGESTSQSFALTVAEAASFDIITTSLPSAVVGLYYSANIRVLYSGTFAPNAYFNGLPPGVTGGAIGIIPVGGYFDLPLLGIPTAGGIYEVNLFLDGVTTTAGRNFTLAVLPITPPPSPPFEPFSFSQRSFDFYYSIGGQVPSVQSLTVTNVAGWPVDFWISPDSRPSWLNTSYNENMMTAYPGVPFGLGAAVNPQGLAPGTYQMNLRLTGGFPGSPVVIPIRLTVFGVLGVTTPPPPPTPLPTVVASRTAFIRLYHPRLDDHFYTTDRGEAWNASLAGYLPEGDMGYIYTSSQPGTEPVYRLYQARLKNHFYTTKSAEVIAAQWQGFMLEGIIGYAPTAPTSSVDKQIYRFYNAFSGDHVYTTDDYERMLLMLRGYIWEGSLGGREGACWLLATAT